MYACIVRSCVFISVIAAIGVGRENLLEIMHIHLLSSSKGNLAELAAFM